jgi:DNA-binding transcriptional regulator WhiA
MSLEELAENISEIGIEKTKSGLNHWLIKLKKIYYKYI